jgi:hypothetical protein
LPLPHARTRFLTPPELHCFSPFSKVFLVNFGSRIWARVWEEFFGRIIAGASMSLPVAIPQEICTERSRIWSFPRIVLHLGLARISEIDGQIMSHLGGSLSLWLITSQCAYGSILCESKQFWSLIF